MARFFYCLSVMTIVTCLILCDKCSGQEAGPGNDATVTLNLPPEVELSVFVDYVSQRLGIRILYDEQIANKKITIKAPGKIPVNSLLGVLESALKMKGMVLADAGTPGWKRIEDAKALPLIARPGESLDKLKDYDPLAAVTQAFPLQHIDPQQVIQLAQPFLTPQGSKTVTVKDNNVLIITDFAENLLRVSKLIELFDKARAPAIIRSYQVRNGTANELSQQLNQLLSAKSQLTSSGAEAKQDVQVFPDARTNQLHIVGVTNKVAEVYQLAQQLDSPLGLVTKTYRFEYVPADRIDKLVRQYFPPSAMERLYRSTLDEDANLVVIQSTAEVHARVESLKKQLDTPASRTPSPLRFYRLKYADAEEVLDTIQRIAQGNQSQQQQDDRTGVRGVSPLGRGLNQAGGIQRQTEAPLVTGPNSLAQPGFQSPLPPALTQGGGLDPTQQFAGAAGGEADAGGALLSGVARVAADAATNSIVVVGPPSVQKVYEELIRSLDRRRKQVLIEAKVVILDTSDDFSLGIEFSGGDRQGDRRLFEFTSFGLSEVDAINGALSLIPGRGLNWTLVDPNSADVVLRALATHRRAKVTSTPQILVNDNATGRLASVAEVPFTSINASDTVATTSFAGFAEAGTTIEVTPRISDDDLIQLEFLVSLNSFTGAGGDGVPPPRQTDELSSEVTVPDGHTVIIGGLNRSNSSVTKEGIPYIELIPILKELAGSTIENGSEATLFFFLKPVILRDDKFKELKFVSERDLKRAGLSSFPKSGPLILR